MMKGPSFFSGGYCRLTRNRQELSDKHGANFIKSVHPCVFPHRGGHVTGGPVFVAEMMARDDGVGIGFGTCLLDGCLSVDDPRGEDIITWEGQVTSLKQSSHLHEDQEGDDPKQMGWRPLLTGVGTQEIARKLGAEFLLF